MKTETKDKIQNAILAGIAGAIVPIAIGFGGGLWVTKQSAIQMTDSGLLAAKVKICLAQFMNAPNYQEQAVQFKSLDYSSRGAFIEKGAWSKMPGEERASDVVKEACTRELEAVLKK